ncbi:MAG: hypothetical protein JWM91_1670 [Rhodospirillales bacterium]|nr:hypothetical protein [Rhodospirillales bacterium]
MTSRSAPVILGLIAGIALFFVLKLDWNAATAFLQANAVAASLSSPVSRLAWAISVGTAVFATVALLVALIGGAAEIAKARQQIDKLRHDPALADRWNAADWRAAFAHTAIADQAEAMIALAPVDKDEARRVVVDTPLLLGLNRIWLDRLTLTWTIAPLPAIVVGLAATLALFAYEAGDKWGAVLAAGTAGWFIIRLVQYLVRAALAPLVDSAVAGATAAVRPLSAARALDLPRQIVPPSGAAPAKRIEQEEAEIIAAALSHVIWEPLGRLAEAAEKLSSAAAPQSRDQAIESALAEVRAGIEKLLAASDQD